MGSGQRSAGELPVGSGQSQTTDLGEPVHKVQALSTTIGPGPNGEPRAYFFVEGNPTTTGEFAVVDLRTRTTILDVRIPSGNSSGGRKLGLSPKDGNIYFGAGNTGDVYRHVPGSAGIEHLGRVLPVGEQIWALGVGTDGLIWIGRYPTGALLSLDPQTLQVHDYGQAVAGETYIETIEQVGDFIYAGTEPHAKLAKLDPATGHFTEIPLPDDPSATNVDRLDLRRDRLFVTRNGKVHVLDPATDGVLDTIANVSGRGVSPLDPVAGDTVYFRTIPGPVAAYNLDTKAVQTLSWAPNASPEVWGWVDLADPNLPGQSVAFTFYTNGRVYAYNPTTGKTFYHQSTLMGSGDQITTIGTGPDGNVYAGAYLTPPGMGRWNPDGTGTWELLAGAGQVEGFGTFQGDLVFGRYPSGALYRYDLDKPWAAGTNPGTPATIGNEQNRPQCFVELGDRVAVTSVPETGRHGGAVTLWDPDTNQVEVYRGVVENQTPVALVEHDGLLWGGTSIQGGYGADPVTTEATLFAWDRTTRQTVYQSVPVAGAPNVSGLLIDQGAHLWGIADATLFEFDLAQRTVLRRIVLFPDSDGSRFANTHRLHLNRGRLVGVASNRVFAFDRDTDKVTVLYDGTADGGAAGPVSDLAMDLHDNLYFIAKSTRVYRYALPPDTTAMDR